MRRLQLDRDAEIIGAIRSFCVDIVDSMRRFGGADAFASDKPYQYTIAFSILQIGELSKRLSADFTTKYSEIEWGKIAGFRDVIAHHYGRIDLDVVWETAVYDIPKLLDFCNRINI